jgi:hypothetical protein
MNCFKIYYLHRLDSQQLDSITFFGFSYAEVIKKFMEATNLDETHIYKISKLSDNI